MLPLGGGCEWGGGQRDLPGMPGDAVPRPSEPESRLKSREGERVRGRGEEEEEERRRRRRRVVRGRGGGGGGEQGAGLGSNFPCRALWRWGPSRRGGRCGAAPLQTSHQSRAAPALPAEPPLPLTLLRRMGPPRTPSDPPRVPSYPPHTPRYTSHHPFSPAAQPPPFTVHPTKCPPPNPTKPPSP